MAFNIDEFDATPDERAQVAERPAKPAAPGPVMAGSAEEIVAQMLRPSVPQGEAETVDEAMQVAEDEYMSEVEQRLEVAACYRTLLTDTFFTTPTTAAKRVTYELRAWVRERLAELVGMAPSKPKMTEAEGETLKLLADFTPTHLAALKLMADKAITMMGHLPPPAPAPASRLLTKPPAPTLVKRSAPAATPAPAPQEEAPVKRGAGRPPGAKNKPKDSDEWVQAIRKHADGTEEPLFKKDKDGNMVPQMIRRQKKPMEVPGRIPFPNSSQQMSAATHVVASAQANRGKDQHGQQVGGLVELAKQLPE
jgi:hypothetical protein